MIDEEQSELDGEVAAMQFAGGRTMSQVAADWERDIAWVEAAVRRALLQAIPRREGGTKEPRAEARAANAEALAEARRAQGTLGW